MKYQYFYKDDLPENTISKIRKNLNNMGIFIIEEIWYNNENKLFSCGIKDIKTNFRSNGKGLSQEYALASAYGEFIERLQNQIIYYEVSFSEKDKNKFGFEISNDEIKIKLSEYPELHDSFKKAFLYGNEKFSIYELWEKIIKNKNLNNKEFIFLPFYNVNNKKVTYLPYQFILNFYGSNGMCAGNSNYEALVQGISEIIERYVQREIYFKNITPPTIDDTFIEYNFPDEFELKRLIEEKAKVKIIVKDCSLGKNFPAIGIIIIDTKNDLYAVHFGSEPDLKIALQRCFTEILQGINFNLKGKMKNIKFISKNDKNFYVNFKNLVCNGIGYYPETIFNSKFSYDFEYKNIEFFSSKQKLKYLINIIQKNDFNDIFIRDVSFLGFPSFFIIIPGLSEIDFMTKYKIDNYIKNYNSTYLLSNLKDLNNDEYKYLIDDLMNFKTADIRTENFFINEYFSIPIDNEDWDKITIELLLAMIFYRINNYKKAFFYIDKYIKFIENNYDDVDLSYYYVVRNLFLFLSNGKSFLNSIKKLSLIYEKEIVYEVKKDLENNNKIFDYVPLPNNYNCNECQLQKDCKYNNIRDIYLKIKKIQSINKINQNDLNYLFKELLNDI